MKFPLSDCGKRYSILGKRMEREMYAPALEFLNLQHGTCAWRHNNDAVWVPAKGIYMRRACHQDGIPDLMGVKRKSDGRNQWGQAFAFELKRPGALARVEKAQRAWLERFAACGGVGYLIDDVSEIAEAFPEI